MIKITDLKTKFGFETIEEYFELIINQYAEKKQISAQILYSNLSPKQRVDFIRFFDTAYYYDAMDNDSSTIREVLDLMEFLGENEKSVKKLLNKFGEVV